MGIMKISKIIFLVILAIPVVVINASGAFSDVSNSDDFYDAVEYLSDASIIQGYDDGTFRATNEINRAEFLKIIVEANFDDDEIADCDVKEYTFSDISDDAWYSPYICIGKREEIIAGYSDGTYKPATSINFAEAAKIISNSSGYEAEVDDVWYKAFVDNLAEINAIPVSISSFNENISRGEMAEMIYRIKADVDSKESLDYETINGEKLDYGFGAGLLPLGTNKVSSSPKIGYIYSCNTDMNGGGAFSLGPWIYEDEGYWDPSGKVYVDGDVEWSGANFEIDLNGDERDFSGNGLPTDHNTGTYPISSSDDAYDYDRNPNSIKSQSLSFSLPASPSLLNSAECVPGTVGIALNGIPIFNGFDAGGRDAVAIEIQDYCDGHPERTGQYHYHSLSSCFQDDSGTNEHSSLVGYALDGFGIFGLNGESGEQLKTDDLDECHGHSHEVEWDGESEDIYHYHTTEDFPYTVGCFRGDFDRDKVEDLL